MNVGIDFIPDARQLADVSPEDPVEVLYWTSLVVPISVRTPEGSLFTTPPRPVFAVDVDGIADPDRHGGPGEWIEQPLLGFLRGIREAAIQVIDTGAAEQVLALGAGAITYRRLADGDLLLERGGVRCRVRASELMSAIDRFSANVADWLVSDRRLTSHPAWGDWFPSGSPGGVDPSGTGT